MSAVTALLVAACSSEDAADDGGATSGGGNAGGTTGAGGGDGGDGNAPATTGSGGESTGCASDEECSDPTPVCDVATGTCVGCLPDADNCPDGQFCDPDTSTCEDGCTGAEDCPADLNCDPATNLCVGCVDDTDCAAGFICVSDACVPGCSSTQPCASPDETCCGSSCKNVTTDAMNCGMCNNACPVPANAEAVCNAGLCGMGACTGAFANCNGQSSDGCEQNTLQDGDCVCSAGSTQACYQGAPGTQNVGPCKGGTQTCNPDGLGWGPCVGQVLPGPELCADNIDQDCDGTNDNAPDSDADGWTACNGDCCDSLLDGCVDPKLVNPGAFEFGNNSTDDDCDGNVDNVLSTCDSGLSSNSSTGLDYAKAIDLCQTTTENPTLPNKKWGVISGVIRRTDGSANPDADARSIRSGFGTNVVPLQGSRLAVISTGHAADQNDSSPNYAAFQGGQNLGITSPVPSDWLQANGNNFPNAPGCPEPQGGTVANDPIMLKFRVRVPTNVQSFSVSTYFYSAEYPEWVCSPYNDFFLALLDSTQTPNPADKNLAFFDPSPAGPPYYPVGVNLAFGNTGLFTQCKNGATGCGGGSVPGNTNTCVGTTGLAGTGFQLLNPASQFSGDPGYCGTNNLLGGGTGWLVTSGNVKPGETIELRFAIWDTGDPWYDSVALIDNFVWQAAPTTPGTHN